MTHNMTWFKRTIAAAIGLCITVMTFAQTDYAAIQNRFTQYRERAIQEKIFVHTDKEFYLAGEIVWFSLFYVEGTTHKPLDLSKVAYVELIDKDNKPAMQAKIALKQGHGDGSFFLPVTVPTGNYLLRAYTNWMKNFGPEYFFQKTVSIVNTLKSPQQTIRDTTLRYDIQFLPEGGHLVKGIESKVAFRITDQYGKGIDCGGVLLGENRDTLQQFNTYKFGMGSFLFKPSAAGIYKAIINLPNGEAVYRDLPTVEEQGYVLRVREDGSGNVTATVNTAYSQSQDVFLFIHTRQSVKLAERKALSNGTAVFTIPENQLGEGISHFTLFDQRQQPVCERLYFRRPGAGLSIAANADARSYAVRKKVSVSVSSKAAQSAVPADMSLSVYRTDDLQGAGAQDIRTYLWLSSDLRGNIESPEYYFSANTPEVKQALDNLMLVHGWRKFNWSTLLNTRDFAFEHVPEFDGHVITGKIFTPANNAPLPDIKSYLSVPGYPIRFFVSGSDGDGIVRFDVRDYYGQGEIVLQADITDQRLFRIEGNNPFSERFTGIALPPYNVSAATQSWLKQHNLGMQVQNTYAGEKLSRFEIPDVDTLAFYGVPYKKYWLDEFVRFTTMEEVLREYVPEVAVRRYGGEMHLWVFYFDQDRFFNSDPLILLDGVPVSNTEILAYDPLKVKKLEVIPEKYIVGEFTYEGVVSFTTYRGELDDFKLNPKAVKLDYEGLQMKREFFSPVYETPEQAGSRVPDFRNVLYWAPEIKTDKSGNARVNFFTSDVKGKYIAVIQGLDENGNAGSYTFSFEVE
jgi:hypothetical protein